MIQWQMSNLVIGVGPCPTRITPATSDRVGACGTKLLNGFVKSPVAGRSTASLPVRPQCTNTARAWQARKFLPREGSPAGDWFAPPEELDMQPVNYQRSSPFEFLGSLLRFRSGWFSRLFPFVTTKRRRLSNRYAQNQSMWFQFD